MKNEENINPNHVLKNAIRKCGHREDYFSAIRPHRLEEFASLTDCSSCKKLQFQERTKREEARRQIALKWVEDHHIEVEPHLDVSDGYGGDVEVRFFIKTGIKA